MGPSLPRWSGVGSNGRFPPGGRALASKPPSTPPQDRLYFVMEYVTGRLDVPHSTAGQV